MIEALLRAASRYGLVSEEITPFGGKTGWRLNGGCVKFKKATPGSHAASLMEVHLSLVGNRTNEAMKVLTIISTIFIPLSFIAGVYGMNFNTEASPYNMPELNWPHGYPIVLTAMAVIAAGIYLYIRKKRWI